MGTCREPLLDKYAHYYCCCSSAGCWQTHANIKAPCLEIGGQAVEKELLWTEKMNEGNSIASYLRRSPAPSQSVIYTYKQTHTREVTPKKACPPQVISSSEDAAIGPDQSCSVTLRGNTCWLIQSLKLNAMRCWRRRVEGKPQLSKLLSLPHGILFTCQSIIYCMHLE